MTRVVAIVGPTASGKTRLAVELAQRLGGEIVNADSRQVYRFMDIGTAKPGPEERRLVPHHLLDVVNPDEPFSLAAYQQMASEAIAGISARGQLPVTSHQSPITGHQSPVTRHPSPVTFLVGGAGLYVWAVLEGWRIPRVAPSPELRARLESAAGVRGSAGLHEELRAVDPVAAGMIAPTNLRRVVRALEVYYATGKPISEQWSKKPPAFAARIVGLTMPRAELYSRIDARVDRMMDAGLVEEVEGLLGKGYNLELPSMSGIGYRQIGMHLQGKVSLAEAVREMKYDTHRVARHQYAWFRLSDKRIRWFEAGCDSADSLTGEVERWLRSCDGGT